MEVEDGGIAHEPQEQQDRRLVADLIVAVAPQARLAQRPHLVLLGDAHARRRALGEQLDASPGAELCAFDLAPNPLRSVQCTAGRVHSSALRMRLACCLLAVEG